MTNPTSNSAPVALITGAARRIGAAIATHLHQRGFNIVLHYGRSAEAAKRLTDGFNQLRADSAIMLTADLLQTHLLPVLMTQAASHWQRLDALINNASSFYPTPIDQINEHQWQDLIGTNLKAPLFLSQAAVPYLRKQNGNIINIVDIHADRPMPHHTVYSIAKAGLVALTKSLAKDLAPEVRVNAVAPGAILWPEAQNNTEPAEIDKDSILQRIALQRSGAPEDIAHAVGFLICEAAYTTGHVLPVDGGRNLFI